MNDDTRRLRIEANHLQITAMYEAIERLHTDLMRLVDETQALQREAAVHVDTH